MMYKYSQHGEVSSKLVISSEKERMGKRLRKPRTICSCKSPRLSHFNCYEEDIWTEVAKYLDGKSLVKLAATCRWFHNVIMHDSIWRFVCLRDLQVPTPCHVSFKWIKIYASLADGTHSYLFRDPEKHLDWLRIGAFFFDSQIALLTERPKLPLKIRSQDLIEKTLESCGACVLTNVKKGIWIADLQLVRCPVCELDTCEGTMQTLDARHIELFLCKGYQDRSWDYEQVGSCKVNDSACAASGAIFDLKHLRDHQVNGCKKSDTSGVFNLKTWTGKPGDLQPKAIITFHSVAISTNLQVNQGLLTKYYAMRAGSDGEVVSIRISQQLL